MPKGWNMDRTDNIESVYNPATNTKIMYQNVDIAASRAREPKAISGKGNAVQKMIENGSLFLFSDMEDEYLKLQAGNAKKDNAPMWFLCVSVIGDEVCAELSRPHSVEKNQFSGFVERIFIMKSGDWNNFNISNNDIENNFDDDHDVEVTRKKD